MKLKTLNQRQAGILGPTILDNAATTAINMIAHTISIKAQAVPVITTSP